MIFEKKHTRGIMGNSKDEIIVLLQEEYGYREWLWIPQMNEEELKQWWKSLPSVAPFFFSPDLPGEKHQIWYQDAEDEDIFTAANPPDESDYFFLVEVSGPREVSAISRKERVPKNVWRAHLHTDNDSHLITPEGEMILHAGWVSDEEYFSDDYKPSSEIEEAWGKATCEAMQKIVVEHSAEE